MTTPASRRVFIAGMVLFSLASLLGGFATTQAWLLAARAAQGVGAAVIAPTALSLITITFPEGPPRNRAMGVYSAMSIGGVAVGLIGGGLLTTYASWRWVLFVNVPIGAAVALIAPRALAHSPRTRGRFDFSGAITSTLGVVALVYGLTSAATSQNGVSHWGDTKVIVALTAAVVPLAAFIVIESRSEHALMPLRIFRNWDRSAANLIMLFVGTAMFGMFFFLTIFVQTVWGYSALKAGIAYLPLVTGVMAMAGVSAALVPRIRARPLLLAGSAAAAGGMVWLSRISEHSMPTAAQVKTAIYDHALSVGFGRGSEVSAGIMLIALIITIAAVRVRRADLAGAQAPPASPAGDDASAEMAEAG